MSILLKYLEERRDEYGNNVFGANFFQKFGNANTFVDVFKTKGACLQLFDYLSNKDQYNGGIFCWNDIAASCVKGIHSFMRKLTKKGGV